MALELSPVSSIVYACSLYDMKNWGLGVYKKHPDDCETTELAHTVVVIGYGTTSRGEEYWEVKNSYSSSWGDNGYLKYARNVEWEEG